MSSLATAKSSIAVLSKFPVFQSFSFNPVMLSVSMPCVWCWWEGNGVALLTKGSQQHSIDLSQVLGCELKTLIFIVTCQKRPQNPTLKAQSGLRTKKPIKHVRSQSNWKKTGLKIRSVDCLAKDALAADKRLFKYTKATKAARKSVGMLMTRV